MRLDGSDSCEVAIVGGGIAGASLAYFLAADGLSDVVLLERERTTAYHASGRSARTLLEIDPNPVVQSLKILGARFLRCPPQGFSSRRLLERCGAMRLVCAEDRRDIERRAAQLAAAGLVFDLLDPAAVAARVCVLDATTFGGAVFLPDDGFIDVPALLGGYLDAARSAGVEVRTGVSVLDVRGEGGRASAVVTDRGVLRARWIVNAAGAWAGRLARMAGASTLELTALRRSIASFPVPAGLEHVGVERWPLVWSDPHAVYFRPGFDGLMVCAMDQTPSPPCDAACDPLVIEEAMSRLALLAPRLAPRRATGAATAAACTGFTRRWAGLRTFAADGAPVVGEDTRLRGFFWLAGQGGCGIETSPILGRLAADLITTGTSDAFELDLLSPRRFG